MIIELDKNRWNGENEKRHLKTSERMTPLIM